MRNWILISILIFVLVAPFAYLATGGIWDTKAGPGAFIWKINKITGDVQICSARGCSNAIQTVKPKPLTDRDVFPPK